MAHAGAFVDHRDISLFESRQVAKWFRGSDTDRRTVSRCPDPTCCKAPTAAQRRRWDGVVWPSARDRSHVVSGLPTESMPFAPYPGVDMVEVYNFLDDRTS